MKPLWILLVLIMLLAMFTGEACGKSIKAYYNGQEATVTGVVLHVGESFTVDLYMTPDRESVAIAEIDEPGTTRAYDLLEGDAFVPSGPKRCNASNPAHYRWVMAANDYWLDGTAPLNIFYQLNDIGSNDPSASGYFTVVEAYIAPGNDSETTAGTATESTPGPDLAVTAIVVTMAAMVAAKARRK